MLAGIRIVAVTLIIFAVWNTDTRAQESLSVFWYKLKEDVDTVIDKATGEPVASQQAKEEGTSQSSQASTLSPVATISSSLGGDPVRGEKIFKKCAICHSLQNRNKMGPTLYGVFGRVAGTVPKYRYSPGMKNSGVVWTEETLDQFLSDPSEFIPQTKKSRVRTRNRQDRADIIAYLKKMTEAQGAAPQMKQK